MYLTHQDQIGIHVALHLMVLSNIYSRSESGHVVDIALQADEDRFALIVFSPESDSHFQQDFG